MNPLLSHNIHTMTLDDLKKSTAKLLTARHKSKYCLEFKFIEPFTFTHSIKITNWPFLFPIIITKPVEFLYEIVKRFNSSIDLDVPVSASADSYTLLQLLCKYARCVSYPDMIKKIKFLVKHSDINLKQFRFNALDHALYNSNYESSEEVVKILLKAGAKPIIRTPTNDVDISIVNPSTLHSYFKGLCMGLGYEETFNTAVNLKKVVQRGKAKPGLLGLLISYHPNIVRSIDNYDQSLLHVIAEYGYSLWAMELMEELLKHSSVIDNINSVDSLGKTALDIAVRTNMNLGKGSNSNIIKCLIKHNAYIHPNYSEFLRTRGIFDELDIAQAYTLSNQNKAELEDVQDNLVYFSDAEDKINDRIDKLEQKVHEQQKTIVMLTALVKNNDNGHDDSDDNMQELYAEHNEYINSLRKRLESALN